MKRKFIGRRAFTLIELLIVIAIIAILTVVFLPTLRGGQAKARDAARMSLVSDVFATIEKNYNEGTALPDGAGACISDYAANPGLTLATWLTRVPQTWPAITTTAGAGHLCAGGASQLYYKKVNANSYLLAIELENKDSANVKQDQTAANVQAIATQAALITATAGAVGTGDTNGNSDSKYYYVVGKLP